MLRRIYRLLLLVAPAGIRRDLGREMEDLFVFGVETRAAGRGALGRAAVVAAGLVDALTFALSARFRRAVPDGQSGLASRQRSTLMRRQDLLGTLRFVRQQPAFAGAIVGMLALGIGATTALWSVVYGVLLKPLPFVEPDRIVEVYGTKPDRGWARVSLTEANFWDLRDMNHVFSDFGAWHSASAILLGGDAPEQVSAAFVSSGFFRSLGVRPVAGRLFVPEEDRAADPARPTILGHALWLRRYGGDPGIVGKTIAFGSGPHTVVGVLPAGTPWLDSAEVFVPFVRRADANRGSFEYAAVGRLKPGVSIDAAQADLSVVAAALARQYPETNAGLGVALLPSRDWIASADLRRALWVLLGAVCLLLAIACVNAANLLLARAASRVRERAMRVALGAGRADLIRESLVESLILSVIATTIGLLIAMGLINAIRAFGPGNLPRLDDVGLNMWVLVGAAVLALVVGVATGLAPALQAPRRDVLPALRAGQRGALGDGQSRVRAVLVGAEVALSLTLLIGAGLLARSLGQVLSVDRGFQTDRRLVATISVPSSYGDRIDRTATDVLARIRAMPDVISAATVSGRPLQGGGTGLGFAAGDRPDAPGGAIPWASWRVVSPDYFETMGVPLLAGRNFTTDETPGKPRRTIVSARVASLLWPGENAVGRRIILWKGQSDEPGEVIGVVGDMREQSLEDDPTLAVYFPNGGRQSSVLQVVMHTRRDPERVVPELRAAIADVDRNLPISNVRSLDQLVTRSLATRRFTILLLGAFAGLAAVLALAGVYGVLAYAVTRRTGEVGVRLALGAAPGQVLRLVVAQGLRPVLAGLIAGVALALLLSRLLASLLFGVTGTDPLTYGAAIGLFAATAVLACYLPARSVLRVNPVIALRTE